MAPLLVPALVAALAGQWPSLSREATPFGAGAQDAAVVAGVSKPFVLPEVKGAAESATDWYLWLTQARGIPVERVQLLRDGQVTREQLLAAAQQARGQVGPQGTLWIVFIGHGAPSPSGDDGLLLGVDVQRNERSLKERGLPQRELLEAAAGAQRQTVAIIDACFSGMASDGVTPLVEGSQATLPVRRAGLPPDTLVLASSEEVAGPLPGHDRPAFSYLLLGALRGWADEDKDQRITAQEAFRYAQRSLIASVRDKDQQPTLRGAPAALVLAERAGERAPDLARLIADPARPPSVGPSPVPAPVSPGPDVAQREASFRRREILLNADGKWVRADLPNPMTRRDLLVAAGDDAPAAKKTVEDAETRAVWFPVVWSVPPVAGLGLGAVAGVIGGLVINSAMGGGADAERAGFLGGFIGAFAGAATGALAVSLPLGAGLLGDDDPARLKNAEAQLAQAANAAERERLGLPPR